MTRLLNIAPKIRRIIVNSLFGSRGLSSHHDMATFEGHVEGLKKGVLATESGALASKYVVDNIIPLLKDNLRAGREKWKNNKCESINHMLNAAVNWKSQDLPKITRTLQTIVYAQYIDATRAIYGKGNYCLRDRNAKHQLTFEDWRAMSVY